MDYRCSELGERERERAQKRWNRVELSLVIIEKISYFPLGHTMWLVSHEDYSSLFSVLFFGHLALALKVFSYLPSPNSFSFIIIHITLFQNILLLPSITLTYKTVFSLFEFTLRLWVFSLSHFWIQFIQIFGAEENRLNISSPNYGST